MIKRLPRAWSNNPNRTALTGDLDWIVDKLNEVIEEINKEKK